MTDYTSPTGPIDLAPGTYNLTVTKVGYRTQTRQVVITDGCDITESFTLLPASGKLTVTTTPSEATISVVAA